MTKLKGTNQTIYKPNKERETELNGNRYKYLPLDQIDITPTCKLEGKDGYSNIFIRKLKSVGEEGKKGIWISPERPSFVSVKEEVGVVKPKFLEEQVKSFSPENGSRLLTLAEALVLLEYIRQEGDYKVEELASVAGIQNEVIPYMTNRKCALLLKTERGYAILGAGEYYKQKLPATDVQEIPSDGFITKEIQPVMVLEGVPI